MKELAKGTNSEVIFKVLQVLINTQQSDFGEALVHDMTVLKDIADSIEVEQNVYNDYGDEEG